MKLKNIRPGKIFQKFSVLIFVITFASFATVYIVATHAQAGTFYILMNVVDTNNNFLSGAYVDLGSNNGCTYPFGHKTVSPNAPVVITCNNASVSNNYSVKSLSLPGYSVCGCSLVQIGTPLIASSGLLNTSAYKIVSTGNQIPTVEGTATMQSNTPAPIIPTPTPPPSPPPSSGSTGSSKSTSKSVTVTPSPSTSSSAQAAPTTNDLQPATDSTGDLTGDTNVNVPADTTSVISSSDYIVSIIFQKGTFDVDAYCTVDSTDKSGFPIKSSALLGPYLLACTDVDGNSLNTLMKPITVNMALPSSKSKYVAYINDSKWQTTPSTEKNRTLSFKMTKVNAFAAAPKKTTNWGAIIIDMISIIVVLLVIGFIAYLIRRRQYVDGPPMDYPGDYPTESQ
ncbi:MAG TPA: hypothetical protein VLF79_02675 [Candidatus Saccharimonadales bacterium]|nr:hypothetical protein [Candidatus Saccharimonadales bacterium]